MFYYELKRCNWSFPTVAGESYLSSPQVLPCCLNVNNLLLVRLKPVEQLSPMPSPGDFETKFERKKSQPSHVGTRSNLTVLTKLCTNCSRFCSLHNETNVCSVLFSYQKQMLSIISYSRRSAKTRYSNKVSFSFSVSPREAK